jgi:CubicO group peptidase (beta-lactamase class C family)
VPRCLLPVLLACLAWLPPAALPRTTDSPPPTGAWQDIGQQLDRILTTQLWLYDIPGASVALVGDGRVLHLGGYGIADLDSRTLVSADQTLFGTGSVSKLLTSTAVMQLVGEGTLSLTRDVNDYLEALQLPVSWPRPVTLANLLTHTAGFEQRAFGFYARRAVDVMPLPDFLVEYLPARVYPPGEVSAYSNYGAALAGHIAARAGGLPFEQLVETRILAPLGMTRSTFHQPLPPELDADLATGYRGKADLAGHGWYQARPAAALRTTAADMSRFMLALLAPGRPGGTTVLAPAELDAMQQRQFGNHPAVSGLTYGLQELQRAGQRILWQPGDTLFYSAAVFLLPEPGIGLFVAYNRAGVRHARLELLDAILARLAPFGYRPTPPASGIDTGTSARVVGHYRSTRSGVTSLEGLFAPFSGVRVREREPGVLHIRGLAMVEDAVWLEQSPGVFRDSASAETVVFETDTASGSDWLFEANAPAFAYRRLPWYATPPVQAALLAGCALVFLAVPAGWTLQAWRGGWHAPDATDLARRLAAALCATNLALLTGLVLLLTRGQQLLFGLPPFSDALLMLPWLSVALTPPVAVLALFVWLRQGDSRAARLSLLLVAVAGLVFAGMLYHWGLL